MIKKLRIGEIVWICNPMRDGVEDIRQGMVSSKIIPGIHNILVAEQWPVALCFRSKNEAIQAIQDKLESLKNDNQ